MSKLEQHRKIWQGKSDEWIFERLANELSDKVETIHGLLDENNSLKAIICDCQYYENGLVRNSCKIHNENPRELNNDWN